MKKVRRKHLSFLNRPYSIALSWDLRWIDAIDFPLSIHAKSQLEMILKFKDIVPRSPLELPDHMACI